MIQRIGQSESQPESIKPKVNYTGERPRVYRKVVELLAEPREQMSIRQICRLCHVTDDTVKAVQTREAVSLGKPMSSNLSPLQQLCRTVKPLLILALRPV